MGKLPILIASIFAIFIAHTAVAQDYSKYSEEALKEILDEIAVVET
ncbi:MAG: hypothetical protein JKY84_06825, partial [Emcibacteraceae bacterium]|nr:hypothetical protein [Emcibacteraceae bacterium]